MRYPKTLFKEPFKKYAMDPQDTIDLSREALTMIGIVGGPILASGLLIGLVVGVFQAMTQIQDQTVSAVPKILGMLLVTMLVLPWVGEQMIDYTRETLSTPFTGGFAQTHAARQESPFHLASAKADPAIAPERLRMSVAQVAANRAMPVAPPLKSTTESAFSTSMPTLVPRASSMPIHRLGPGPTKVESSMPRLRGRNLTVPPTPQKNLEG
jgi:flagellar biosynthetic protein FliQ